MSQNCTHLRINNGFAGQIWLTDEQWDTYRRVPPVRYVRHKLVTSNNSDSIVQCFSCGKTDSIKNLQVAHLIGHSAGIVDWGLTPDWLESPDNLVFTHPGQCNNNVALSPEGIVERLSTLNLDINNSPAVRNNYVRVTKQVDNTWRVIFSS